MKLLLDSANLDEIRDLTRSRMVCGVTTNPSLVAKEPNSAGYIAAMQDVVKVVANSAGPEHFSLEVTTLDPDGMLLEATHLREQLAGLGHPTRSWFHVKIPVTPESMRIISSLSTVGIQVNATACMTAMQAKLASDAGASVVSFFFNRMIDHLQQPGSDLTEARYEARELALREIATYRSLFNQGHAQAEIICGSIRGSQDVMDCWLAGAHFVTASAKVIRECIEHPKTRESIEGFQRDIDAWLA